MNMLSKQTLNNFFIAGLSFEELPEEDENENEEEEKKKEEENEEM